jgi:secreted PhoX family phosphatase
MSGGSLFAPSLAGLVSWRSAEGGSVRRGDIAHLGQGGYGPLVPSEDCPEFRVPAGFHCKRLSTTLLPSTVNPSLTVPPAFDGMASFPLPGGTIRLIRNHEVADGAARAQPIGIRPYDPRAGGGTSSLEVRVRHEGPETFVDLLAEYVSLSGTHINCAGGPTPWGSWLSCEETAAGANSGFTQPHGYIFEVAVSATEEVEPVPLRAMGRFVHEAIAVDPSSGIVYETEDAWWRAGDPERSPGAGFYRFIPDRPSQLAEGGRLQILAIDGAPGYDTITNQVAGRALPVVWMDIDDPDPAGAERDPSAVFRAARTRGAAKFQRLEGCFWADDGVYFISTNGGNAAAGQVWHYRPTAPDRGNLVLIFESPSRDVLEGPDNICASPRGGLVICEDGNADQFIRGLTPAGTIVDLVQAPVPPDGPEPTEFCGSCFSPDGRVLFFNVQGTRSRLGAQPGHTYALWGPWEVGAI